MPKTILELSKELNVSKTAINKLLTPDKRKRYVSKKGNRFLISDDGVNAIKAHFEGNIDNQTDNIENNANKTAQNDNQTANQVGDINQELVDALKAELVEKNKQLAAKDDQINTVHTLLDQQQKLTLQANQQISKLESQVKQLQLAESSESTDTIDVEPESKTAPLKPTTLETETKTSKTESQTKNHKKHWWNPWG